MHRHTWFFGLTVDVSTDVALTSDDRLMYVPSLPSVSIKVMDSATGEVFHSIGGPGILNEECEIVLGMRDGIFGVTNFAPLDCNDNGIPDDLEYPGCKGFLLGDMNCDEAANGLDIQPFVDYVVIDPYTCQADMNQDGLVDIGDIPGFIDTLLGL